MLRVVAVEEPGGGVRLRLEGRVAGPWVEELRRACQRAGHHGVLSLDLADVTFIDRGGAEFLGELARGGVCLVNGSPFVRERLRGLGGQRPAEATAGREERG